MNHNEIQSRSDNSNEILNYNNIPSCNNLLQKTWCAVSDASKTNDFIRIPINGSTMEGQ